MKSHLNVMRNPWTRFLVAAVCVVALTGTAAVADSSAESGDTFTWSAELVALEPAAAMITVKSLVVGTQAIDWSSFETGDQVLVTWSGITSGSGIRFVSPDADTLKDALKEARLTMPAEFVSTEMDGRYVTYRVAVPETDWSSIESLTPGEWVTATSPSSTSVGGQSVATIRPYNIVG